VSAKENSLSFETVKQKDVSKYVLNTVPYLLIFAFQDYLSDNSKE